MKTELKEEISQKDYDNVCVLRSIEYELCLRIEKLLSKKKLDDFTFFLCSEILESNTYTEHSELLKIYVDFYNELRFVKRNYAIDDLIYILKNVDRKHQISPDEIRAMTAIFNTIKREN